MFNKCLFNGQTIDKATITIVGTNTEKGSNLPMLTQGVCNKHKIEIADNYITRYQSFNHFIIFTTKRYIKISIMHVSALPQCHLTLLH